DGVLERPRTPHIFSLAQMEDEKTKPNLFRNLERALDLVHGIDATAFLRVNHVDRGRSTPTHLRIGVQRRVHREGLRGVSSEPLGQLSDERTAGVVEMLA